MGWYNASWLHRKSHVIIGSSGAGTNYQIQIIVHKGAGIDGGNDVYLGGNCLDNFGDIRFTADDGITLLDYWIESYVSGTSAVIWVEVSANLGTDETIYIYYDNSGATTTSNGDDTFLLFDNFLGSSLDTNKWVSWIAGNGTVTVNNGLTLYDPAQLNCGAGIRSLATFTNKALRFKGIYDAGATGIYQALGFNLGTDGTSINDLIVGLMWNNEDGRFYTAKSSTATSTSVTIGKTISHIYDVTWMLNRAELLKDGGSLATHTTNIQTSANYVFPRIWTYSGNPAVTTTTTIAWICVRNFIYPEPVNSTWGNEETELKYNIDVIFQKPLPYNVDVIIAPMPVQLPANVDVALQKLDVPLTEPLDVTIERLRLTKNEQADVTIQRLDIPITEPVDVTLELKGKKTYNIDELFAMLGITKTDSVDTLVTKLNENQMNNIDVIIKGIMYQIDTKFILGNIKSTDLVDAIIDAFQLKGRMNAVKESLMNKIATYGASTSYNLAVIDAWRMPTYNFNAFEGNLISVKIMPSKMSRLSFGSIITNQYFGQYYTYRFTMHVLSRYVDLTTYPQPVPLLEAKTAMNIAKGLINYLRINQTDPNNGVLAITDITARESDPAGLTRGGAHLARIIIEGVAFAERPYRHKYEVT